MNPSIPIQIRTSSCDLICFDDYPDDSQHHATGVLVTSTPEQRSFSRSAFRSRAADTRRTRTIRPAAGVPVIRLVDLELARVAVGVAVRGRLELSRRAVFQPIVSARVEPVRIDGEGIRGGSVGSGPDDAPPMSVVIDAALAHLVENEENIREARDEQGPVTIQELCNTSIIGLQYRT